MTTPDQQSTNAADPTSTDTVRDKYAHAARQVATGGTASCCGTSCCDGKSCTDPMTGNLYGDDETAVLPEQAVRGSLGCGNPTALATLREGETVLDLGSCMPTKTSWPSSQPRGSTPRWWRRK
jgi:arsenite methyltransferase